MELKVKRKIRRKDIERRGEIEDTDMEINGNKEDVYLERGCGGRYSVKRD